jgi:hypothetical protein
VNESEKANGQNGGDKILLIDKKTGPSKLVASFKYHAALSVWQMRMLSRLIDSIQFTD